MNPQISKNVKDKSILLNLSKRKREYITDFTLEKGLTCVNTEFQNKKGIVSHIPLLNVCLPIVELSRQRYV